MTDQEKIEKLMNHPVFIGHDANAKIIRAQLFFVAASTIFFVCSGLDIGKQSSIVGLSLKGLEKKHILTLAIALLAYQIIHFLWASVEAFMEWRVRLTALDTGGWGGGGLEIRHENSSDKIRQTTLYAYLFYVLNINAKKFDRDATNQATEQKIEELKTAAQNIAKTLESERISDSLLRFDNWLKIFCRVQNLRWFLLEFSLPVALGILALTLAAKELSLIACQTKGGA